MQQSVFEMALSIGKRYSEYFIYLFFWGILMLSPVWGDFIGVSGSNLTFDELLNFWEFLLPAAVMFILNNWILVPFFLYKKRGGYYIIYSLCVVVASCMIYIFSTDFEKKPPPLPDRVMHEGVPPKDFSHDDMRPHDGFRHPMPHRHHHKKEPGKRLLFTVSNPGSMKVLIVVFVLFFNICVRMTFFAMRRDERYQELEREKLKAELEYLKYQINPHFFMNTLNNIHSLIDIDGGRAQKAVVKLSKMMRYVLYDSTSSLVPLEKDLVFLKSYIDLMRLRYTERLTVKLNFDAEDARGVYVPSLLLIVFVENAFKHGVSYNKESDIDVSVSVDEASETVLFACSNSLCGDDAGALDTASKGIGIENARKRLGLIYGGKASLEITNDGSRYNVVLKIPMSYDKVLDN